MLKDVVKNTWVFALVTAIIATVLTGSILKLTDNDNETVRKSSIKTFVLVFFVNAAVLFWANSTESISSEPY